MQTVRVSFCVSGRAPPDEKCGSHQIFWILDLYNLSSRYDDKSKTLELCGLRSQARNALGLRLSPGQKVSASKVEDAKLMISVHREYLPVYKDMDEARISVPLAL